MTTTNPFTLPNPGKPVGRYQCSRGFVSAGRAGIWFNYFYCDGGSVSDLPPTAFVRRLALPRPPHDDSVDLSAAGARRFDWFLTLPLNQWVRVTLPDLHGFVLKLGTLAPKSTADLSAN